MMLSHLSDDPDIKRFEPRPSAYTTMPVVWAIAKERLPNYLLPRDCPRVCFRVGTGSNADDRARWLGEDQAVVAIEQAWLDRVRAGALWRYTMPTDGFRLQDEGAGYWVSEGAVVPLGVEHVTNLAAAIADHGATLRVLPSLWALHDAVAASSLVFSMIRMRNAAAR